MRDQSSRNFGDLENFFFFFFFQSLKCGYEGGERADHESLVPMLRRENWPGSSVSPVETWKFFSKFFQSLKCRYKGEKRGQAPVYSDPAVEKDGQPRLFFPHEHVYSPPRVLRGRRGPTNHDSRPYATAEKVAKLESLSPIFKVSNVATGGGERGQARVFFFFPLRRCGNDHGVERRLYRGERGPTADLSRPPGRERLPTGPLPPL